MTWALRDGQRVRLVTLTQCPTTPDGSLDWQRTRGQVRDLCRRVRATGRQCEWAWAVEQNPRRTGFHIHLIQKGDYLPQRELQDMWGGRRVDIRQVRPDSGGYITKSAAIVTGYVTKAAGQSVWDHLAINGDRTYHSSATFHRGIPRAEAWRRLMAEMHDGPPPLEQIVPAEDWERDQP